MDYKFIRDFTVAGVPVETGAKIKITELEPQEEFRDRNVMKVEIITSFVSVETYIPLLDFIKLIDEGIVTVVN